MVTVNGYTATELEWLEAAQGTFRALCRGFKRPRKEKQRAAKFLLDLHKAGVKIPERYVKYAEGLLIQQDD
jgi:hypothetical protein